MLQIKFGRSSRTLPVPAGRVPQAKPKPAPPTTPHFAARSVDGGSLAAPVASRKPRRDYTSAELSANLALLRRLEGDGAMAESARSNRLVWALAVLAVLLVAGAAWVWTLGSTLSAVDQRSRELDARLAAFAPADALAALTDKQAELEAKLATLDPSDTAPLKAEIDDLRSGFETLAARLGDFSPAALEAFGTRLAAVEAAVGDDAAEPVRTALDDLRTDTETLHSRLDALERRLGATAEPDLSQIGAELAALTERLAGVEADVTTLAAADPAGLQARLDALAATLAATTVPDIAPLETQIGGVASDVEALKAGLAGAATAGSVDALESRLADLAGQMAGSGDTLSSLGDDVAALSAEAGDIRAALTDKAGSAEVAALSDRLDALSSQIAALPATDAGALDETVGALRAALAALEAEVAALPGAAEIAALRSDLQAMRDSPVTAQPPQVLERIYFGQSSTAVSEAEQTKILAIARQLDASPGAIALVGFSDSLGPAEFNRALSLRRAAAVRRALLEAGVDQAAVTSVIGLGEDAPPIATEDGVEEAGNRVVLIYGH